MHALSLAHLPKANILVVGDIMLDRYWFGDVNRISPEAPVPVVLVQRCEDRLGGAANVARNAAALGANVSLLGVIGKDEAGAQIVQLLEEAQIHPYLHQDASVATIVKLRVIGQQQQLVRIDFEKAPNQTILNNKFSQFSQLLPSCDMVVFSDYAKGSLARVASMISQAKEAGKPILVDPKGEDFSRYAGVTLLTPNKAELLRVVGSWESEAALTEKAQNLRRDLMIEALLLTRSAEGMSLYTENGVHHFPAVAREVFDVSGAGDTVVATLAVMLGGNIPMAEAVRAANIAGGIVVGKLGTATITAPELLVAVSA